MTGVANPFRVGGAAKGSPKQNASFAVSWNRPGNATLCGLQSRLTTSSLLELN